MFHDSRTAKKQGAPAKRLGRGPIYIEGVVVEGQKLARSLGFPTANVELKGPRPRLGSYAARTRLADGRVIPGVASVGCNPTTGLVRPRLEVWLFDFNEDLYGQTIQTELVAFLRAEQKFDDLLALTVQVLADAKQARALLETAARIAEASLAGGYRRQRAPSAEPKRRRGAGSARAVGERDDG